MDHSFLQGNDFVGITFWIVSIGMWAATLFFFYEGMRVSAKWRTSKQYMPDPICPAHIRLVFSPIWCFPCKNELK